MSRSKTPSLVSITACALIAKRKVVSQPLSGRRNDLGASRFMGRREIPLPDHRRPRRSRRQSRELPNALGNRRERKALCCQIVLLVSRQRIVLLARVSQLLVLWTPAYRCCAGPSWISPLAVTVMVWRTGSGTSARSVWLSTSDSRRINHSLSL